MSHRSKELWEPGTIEAIETTEAAEAAEATRSHQEPPGATEATRRGEKKTK